MVKSNPIRPETQDIFFFGPLAILRQHVFQLGLALAFNAGRPAGPELVLNLEAGS
jgi:hypothetical protein